MRTFAPGTFALAAAISFGALQCSVDPRPDPRDLSSDSIGNDWTEQALSRMIASLTPGARAVLHRVTGLGGITSFGEVQQYFADQPITPTGS
ncbi:MULTISPECIES: hypothetical protein [Streptomyces]|uniref:hypothetical protein n=1 Tax=Streptomyces lycopersici TaxID=2974589 RepID=UPI0021CE91AE|nr:hypothetical protein [Streptomyces sp. NEAU-383]